MINLIQNIIIEMTNNPRDFIIYSTTLIVTTLITVNI